MNRRLDLVVAATLAAAGVTLLVATQGSTGIPRDEGLYFSTAARYATWLDAIGEEGLSAFGDATLSRIFSMNREHPALPKLLFGLSHRLLHDRLGWTSNALGFRLPAILFSGLLLALCYLLGVRERTRFSGLFAALAMLATPRHLLHLQIACFDGPATATWLLVVLTYRWALDRPASWRRGALAGLAFGLAISVKHNAYFLPPLLVLHFLWTRGLAWWRAGTWRARASALPRAFPAMALLGPVVLYLTWPYLWHHPIARFGWYLGFHLHHENYSWTYLGRVLREPPFPFAYPFVVTALTVPLPLLLASGAGLAALAGRRLAFVLEWWRARRSPGPHATLENPSPETSVALPERAPEAALRARESDLLVGGLALFPILLIAIPTVPIFGGIKHWMAAMPFLYLLAGEAIEKLVRGASAPRPGPFGLRARLAGAAALVLLPGALATAHYAPFGSTCAYNEIAGGAAGAAGLGMQRHYWSHAVARALPWIGEHAPRGARVYFHEVRFESLRWYKADGRLRADLRPVADPADAEIAVYQLHQEFRDREFQIWTHFHTQRPAYVVAVDGVPLISVYQRPGGS